MLSPPALQYVRRWLYHTGSCVEVSLPGGCSQGWGHRGPGQGWGDGGLSPCAAPSDWTSASALRSPSVQHGWLCRLLQDLLLNVLGKDKGLIVRVVARQQTSGFSGRGKFRLEISKRQLQSIGVSEVVRNTLSSALRGSARLVGGARVLAESCPIPATSREGATEELGAAESSPRGW